VPVGNFKPKKLQKFLSLDTFIQGFYSSASDNQVEDSIRVYLRNSASPYAIVDSAKGILSTSGTVALSFNNISNGVNYYIQLKHRNTIETWSSIAKPFTSSLLNYNFTDSTTKAYGSNQIQIDAAPLRFGIYSGDENQDGSVDVSDVIDIFNDAANFVSGYVVTDVTGDDFVDSSDLLLTFNNSTNFVSVITP